MVFYDNGDLKPSKSKKSEQYFRDKFEIFIRLFDEHFIRHFESHWGETWRHTRNHRFPYIPFCRTNEGKYSVPIQSFFFSILLLKS